MTRLSEIISPDIHEHSGDPAQTPGLWRAEVMSVDTDTRRATVTVPGYSTVRDYDGVPYMLNGTDHVSPGDDAWVGFNDDRDPVIVCWVPA